MTTHLDLATHPAAELWPMLRPDDLASLAESIRQNGLRNPIALCDGMILDGRNRYEACQIAGVEPRFIEFSGGDPYLYVFDQNGERRLDVTNPMKYGIWKKTVAMSDQWQAERDRIADEHKAALSNAKAGNQNASKNNSGTSSTTTGSKSKDNHATRAAAADSAKVDKGTVAKMDALEASDPDLHEKVATGEMALAAAQKQAKRRRLDERRTTIAEQAAAIEVSSDRIDLRHADAESLMSVEPMNLDWIITDPPYPYEHLNCFDLLQAIAVRHLKDGGSLLCMSGQAYLPDVYRMLTDSELTYHWTLGYMTPGGQAVQIFPRKVNTFWKPILWYTKGDYSGEWIGDVCSSKANDNDKQHHHWGQSESGMYDLMRRFIQPHDTVLDPFMGAGTTGIVALDLGASFIGIDRDEDHYNTAKVRLADV